MPSITLAYLSVAAGLLLGFGGFFLPAVTVAGVLVAYGVKASTRWAYAGIGVVFGLGVASFCTHADDACVRTARTSGQVLVRLRTAVSPQSRGYGQVAGTWCGPSVAVAAHGPGAPAGALVRIQGRPKVTDRGLVYDDALMRVIELPGALASWRAAVGRTIDELYHQRAPLARALVIADDRDIDRDVRDQFADAGIVHMLSVSGLHVAILGEAVSLLFGMAGLSRRRVHVATVAAIVAYVLLIGAPSPAVRSAAMLAASRVAQLRQRPTSDWAAWSLGGLLPLLDPREIVSLGYQLSVAGMAALLASGRLLKRLSFARGGWLGGLGREAATTVVATAVTAPVVVGAFGRLSLIAPLTNLLVSPLFALLQPALFLSLALRPLRPVAQVVADGAALLMELVTLVAALGAKVPGAVISVMPSAVTTTFLSVAVAAGVVACASRFWARAAVVALSCLSLAIWSPWLPAAHGVLELHLLDVGQGDAVALRTPRGHWIVVDAGPSWGGRDAGAATVVPYLRRRGGDVAVFTLTHPHVDHVGGAAAILQDVRVSEMWDAARVFGGAAYASTLAAARDHSVSWLRVFPGLSRTIDGVRVDVLAPDSAWTASQDDPNTSSVVLRVSFGERRILLTGDAERAEVGWLTARYASSLRADILKVGHHGSSTSSSDAFLDAVGPRLALISVGTHNRYGHPNREVLQRFDERQIEVLRTDYDGTVVVRTDGDRVWISAHGDTWPLSTCGTAC
ncbi:MAG: DNA internalization-related competence protein ComEC/Rec2 [Gemmatimonadaceae bacterium]